MLHHETHERGKAVESVYKEESYRIIGACFEVYKELGCGFLEAVYQEALQIELGLQGIPFRPQEGLAIRYKGHRLKQDYFPDFICFDKIILEIKAMSGPGRRASRPGPQLPEGDRLPAGPAGESRPLPQGAIRAYRHLI